MPLPAALGQPCLHLPLPWANPAFTSNAPSLRCRHFVMTVEAPLNTNMAPIEAR